MKRKFYKKLPLLSVALILSSGALFGKDNPDFSKMIKPITHKSAIDFIENKGQWISEAKYKSEIPGGALFLTDGGFVYNFINFDDLERIHEEIDKGQSTKNEIIHSHAYKVNFVNANKDIKYVATEKKKEYNNYFESNDKTKWVGHVGKFGSVEQKNIYNGVDVKVYTSREGNSLKYDFIVASGSNPNQIALAFEGVTPVLSKEGNLIIKTTVNEVTEKAPYSYQIIDGKEVSVSSKFQLKKGVLSFVFPNGYNSSYPLIIDPNLVFATFSGGTGSSAFYAHSTAYDKLGNTYTAALAYGAGWPTTIGAFQTNYPGTYSSAINKYSPDGSSLIYSTYFGGTSGTFSNNTEPNTLRVNDNNELVMAGNVTNANMPTTTGAYQTTLNGISDIYVVKFAQDGGSLIGSTYIGGSGMESLLVGTTNSYTGLGSSANPINPTDVAIDNNGDIWVTSNSGSTNFPVTSNAFQSTNGGSQDVVLFKLSSNLTTLIYSTYIGGNGWDGGIGIEYDKQTNNLGVVGYTASSNFPTTAGAYKTTSAGGIDGFALLINNATYLISASTYLGTTGTDIAMRLAFDCASNFYVAGRTNGNYPITATSGQVASGYIFIDKLTPNLAASVASTRTGAATSSIVPSSMMVDICGDVLVSTITSSSLQTGMPLTPNAFTSTPRAFYFAAFLPNFNGLLFGSYFGGLNGSYTTDHYHPGMSRMDPQGIVYQSVCASGSPTSINWPTTPTAFSPTKQNGSTNDNITFKFNFDAVSIGLETEGYGGANDTAVHAIRGCKSAFFKFTRATVDTTPLVIHYLLSGSAINGQDYQLIPNFITIPANQDSAILEIKPLLAPAPIGPTGEREVIISALSPCGCENGQDNIVRVKHAFIYDSLYVKIPTPEVTVCPNTEVTIDGEIDSTLNYFWSPDALIPDTRPLGLTIHPKPTVTTTYSLTVTQPGAPATCPPNIANFKVTVEPIPQIFLPTRDTTVCLVDSVDINVYLNPENFPFIYSWSPSTYLRDATSKNNKFYAPQGDYKLYFSATTPVAHCSNEDSMTIHVIPPIHISSITPVDTTIKYGDQINLSSVSDAVMWLWSPSKYLDDPTILSPTARPLTDMEYTLIIFDKYGCRDTAFSKIKVQYDPNYFIPNAFSPNGDGINDVFEVKNLIYEKLLTFKVFNRYGQTVFESDDLHKGWNGKINGKVAKSDTYFYFISVILPNGKKENYKGDVTLVK